ncbi:MAG: WecB/TagA/CpsF family glycosyltransferase [Syntrophomonadaceae bacterium]
MGKVKINILGCQLDAVDMREALDRIENMVKNRRVASQVITLNAEMAVHAFDNPQLQGVINRAALVTPDGIGIIWAAKRMGYQLPVRVTGIDLVYHLCQMAAKNGYKVFLLGARPGIAEMASAQLVKRYPNLNICGYQDGYFNNSEEVIKRIKDLAPDILLVALGSPKQELWINAYKDQIKVPVSIGVGGSFDVVSGAKKRAPKLFIRLNMEWLYRLIKEPSRIKRQLVLPRFVWMVMKNRK